MSLVSTYEHKVAWGDCDPAGIVFYPNYYRWLDASTHTMFDNAGLPMAKIPEIFGDYGTPLVEAKASFRSPSVWNDVLTIESTISAWQNKTFTVTHSITNGGKLAVEGQEIRVWVSMPPDRPGDLKAEEIPQSFKDYFDK